MKNIYLNSEINLWTSLVLSFTNVIAKIYKGPTQLKLWMPVFQQIHCLDHLSKNKLEKAKSTVYIWTSFDSLHMVPNNVNKTCILFVNETDFYNLKKNINWLIELVLEWHKFVFLPIEIIVRTSWFSTRTTRGNQYFENSTDSFHCLIIFCHLLSTTQFSLYT